MAEQDALIDAKTAPSQSSSCCCCITPPRNLSDEFIDEHFKGNPKFGWWRMPKWQPWKLLDELRDKLTDRQRVPATAVLFTRESKMTMGYASAKDMMSMMYQATKVSGVWEHVPEKLRGVFWMKGNGVGEELMALQHGQWFEKEKILLTPMAPFMWAWPGGTPSQAPFCGAMYGPQTTMIGARILCGSGCNAPPFPPVTYSVKFEDEELTKARIQAGQNLKEDIVNVGTLIPVLPSCCNCCRGYFSLELQPSSMPEPGSHWKRGIWWGPGACTFCEFGSYNFIKVVKANGEPNEPYYSEFLKYMDDVKLFAWSGFDKTDSERTAEFQALQEAAGLS